MERPVSRYLAVAAVVVAAAFAATAEDKKEAPALKGSWSKTVEGGELTFKFAAKDKLVVVVEHDGKSCTLTCESSVDKDGKISAKVTEVTNKDFPSPPEKGYKFSFKFKVDKDAAKLTDFEAANADEVKAIVEGDYKKKKDD